MADDCIFCRIVGGEVPNTTVCEDADTLAFMDIGPIVKGHTLVIPKPHYESIATTPPPVLQALIVTVRRVAQAQYRGLGADGINVTQANGDVAGQVVPHIHFHVIPRFKGDGHKWNWTPREYESQDEMARCAESIRNAIER